MPTGPQRFQYPKTPDEARGSSWEGAHRLHGAGDAAALFRGRPQEMAPWPKAGRQKGQPAFDKERVHAAIRNPQAHMREMDPRSLHASQTWVTQAGVSYYMGNEYRETGKTFRDMDQASNRWPIVYTDARGRNQILSGHHRATAALLRGEQFHVLHIEE